MSDCFAEIAVPLPRVGLLTYRCPEEFVSICRPGVRVTVRVKNRFSMGIVISTSSTPPGFECRFLDQVEDHQPIFDESYLSWLRWMAEYYNYTIGLIVKTLIPSEFFLQTDYNLFPLIETLPPDIQRYSIHRPLLKYIMDHPAFSLSRLKTLFPGKVNPDCLKAWCELGYIRMEAVSVARSSPKTCRLYSLTDQRWDEWHTPDYSKRFPARYRLLKRLEENPAGIRIEDVGHLIRPLMEEGLIKCREETIQRRAALDQKFDPADTEIRLTPRQAEVIGQVESWLGQDRFQPFLLHGVTGSGKTEVYLNLARRCLEMGMSVVVLVPEIALTPKLTWQFRCRLGDEVEVLHSRISSGERYDAWNRIMAGRPVVVIGARSALFAPVHRPGLIIVDEEHEQTYKQSGTAPFYQARDTAVKRAQLSRIPILLGSATPSLESYANVLKGKYRLLELPERIRNNPLPDVYLYDLKNKGLIRNLLCPDLFYFIRHCLENHEQIILFLNRRGYSPYWQCRECGEVAKCPLCDIPLTYHRGQNQLICHYCNYMQSPPSACPACQSPHIFFRGLGLEKVEEELRRLFPDTGIVRMDQDTTRQKDAHYRILKDFEEKKYQILIGTQMVTKGLDFPDVTLVGILMADVGMNLPDFRAFERTFNLVTQVIGRAGRGTRKGRAVIQTYTPENYCLRYARHQDYPGFAHFELDLRQKLDYPPFVHLILIRFQYHDEVVLNREAERFADAFRNSLSPLSACKKILGPAPAPLAKINQQFRVQILVKTTQVIPVNRVFNHLLASFQTDPGFNRIRFFYDVDPLQVL